MDRDATEPPDPDDSEGGAEDEILGTRLKRSALLGRLAATEAAKYAGTYAANLTRSPEHAEDALGRRQVDAARQMVRVLGSMKGLAMKVGQMLSVADLSAVPQAYRAEVQASLDELRDAAPTVGFKEMRRVLEKEYGEPLGQTFRSFDESAVAAASIGQVYRATLHDGREVAVKVQYPGIAAAVRADLQNLGPMLRIAKQIIPGLDVDDMADEIRERMQEELDYELEAANQRAVARAHRGHPFMVVPEVIGELCREKVIVMEFVRGRGYEEIRALPQAERDRAAEMIFRFYFGCMYRHNQFSGDPHPGNSLLLEDGRMAFLDFGLFKRISPAAAERELRIQRLGCEGRGPEMIEQMVLAGMLPDATRATPEGVLEQFRGYAWWFTTDAVLELDPSLATKIVLDFSDPLQSQFHQIRHERLPAEHVFGRRLEMMTLAVMSQLRPSGNWYRIAREWLYDDAPVTELGRQEAAYYASRS